MVAFRRDSRLLEEWFSQAVLGRETFIPDEVCCQLLLPKHAHAIVGQEWNRSCKHDDPWKPETRIIHYHGRKHCRDGLPYGGERWIAAYKEANALDLAGIRSWTPAGDRMLRRFLRGSRPPR